MTLSRNQYLYHRNFQLYPPDNLIIPYHVNPFQTPSQYPQRNLQTPFKHTPDTPDSTSGFQLFNLHCSKRIFNRQTVWHGQYCHYQWPIISVNASCRQVTVYLLRHPLLRGESAKTFILVTCIDNNHITDTLSHTQTTITPSYTYTAITLSHIHATITSSNKHTTITTSHAQAIITVSHAQTTITQWYTQTTITIS